VAGEISSTVENVDVQFDISREKEATSAMVVRAAGQLRKKLHVPEKFGVFVAVRRGCITNTRVKAVAMGSDGQTLGVDNAQRLLPVSCRR
jgi:hypothetical protein